MMKASLYPRIASSLLTNKYDNNVYTKKINNRKKRSPVLFDEQIERTNDDAVIERSSISWCVDRERESLDEVTFVPTTPYRAKRNMLAFVLIIFFFCIFFPFTGLNVTILIIR